MKTPRIAIVTMAYNEAVMLPIWRDHYRRVAPNAELFVIDHGSDDGSAVDLLGASRIPLPRTRMEEWSRTRAVCFFQAGLLQYYDFVIYSDCDELIVADPAVSANLEEHLAIADYDYASPIGLNIHHIVDVEPPLVEGMKLLAQRRCASFRSNMCKPLISKIRLKWEPGFHTCNKPINIDTSLYLFHIKAIDRDRAVQRQQTLRGVRWSQKAIDADHGAHHRFSDKVFLQQFFLDPTHRFHRDGLHPFIFDDEVARTKANEMARASGGPHHVVVGPMVEIPERFRSMM